MDQEFEREIEKIFLEEAYKASAAKAFGTDGKSYHDDNLKKAAKGFVSRLKAMDNAASLLHITKPGTA